MFRWHLSLWFFVTCRGRSIPPLTGELSNRCRFILALEGPMYFVLAVIDFLTHVVPGAQKSLSTFKGIDIFIGDLFALFLCKSQAGNSPLDWPGSVSFIPVVLYIIFLHVLKRYILVTTLPRRFEVISLGLSITLMPIIIVTSEVGSLIGNSYRESPTSNRRLSALTLTFRSYPAATRRPPCPCCRDKQHWWRIFPSVHQQCSPRSIDYISNDQLLHRIYTGNEGLC